MERQLVGSNHSGISIERQQRKPAEGKGTGYSDNSEKEQREQRHAGRWLSLSEKLSSAQMNRPVAMHQGMVTRGFLSFRSWQFESSSLWHRVGSYHVKLLYIFYQCFPKMSETWKCPVSEDTKKRWLLKWPTISNERILSAHSSATHFCWGNYWFIPHNLDVKVIASRLNWSWDFESFYLIMYFSMDWTVFTPYDNLHSFMLHV